jgi:peptidoglycan hydrolase-like protein with peptidoglycan-binding domain
VSNETGIQIMKSRYLIAALAAATTLGLGFAAPASAATPSQASKLSVSARATATRTALALAGCTVDWRGGANGAWYAGYSDTMTVNTKKGQTGDRVREVQCLLTAAAGELDDTNLRPGGVDGDFGSNTKAAVVYAQKTYFFPHDSSQWDGEVGAKTWPKLRRFTDFVR